MEYLYERIAYLRGLAEGMKIDETSDKGKLFNNIIEVLADFADAINELNDQQVELDEYVEALDEDLSTVEDELFGEDDDYDMDEDEDYDYIEVECPHCKEFVYLDEELIDSGEEVLCPNCHEPIEVEFEEDCCCCHGHEQED
ncbi:MAG: CD1247 N-terminal domain-containing protein [Bacillota bacterium]